VKATERRSSVVNDIEPSPGSADELFDHRLLEKLELGLTTALRLVAQSERQAAIAAINALLEFIVSIPGWERRDLGGPLWQLLTALNDLEFGRVGSLLSPNPAVRNRKPDAGMRKILKAYALFCVDVLCRSGWSRTEGCGIVARSLQENGFPLGGRNSSPPWKSVKGWRDRFTKLAEGDQTRATFEGLRAPSRFTGFDDQGAGARLREGSVAGGPSQNGETAPWNKSPLFFQHRAPHVAAFQSEAPTVTQHDSSLDFRIDVVPIGLAKLRPYAKNPRTHSRKQIRQIADSIRRFGFTNPVLVSDDGEIIAGHGRVEAARLLQMASVPAVRLAHLNEAQRKAYVIADNKLALNAGWDCELLAIELQALVDLDFGVEITGFSLAEVDLVLEEARACSTNPQGELADEAPPLPELMSATTRSGDLWLLDRHRLLCGDARSRESFDNLLDGERIDLVFTDPPYNVPIDGHVCGMGRIRHREFAMGAGEMSRAEFTAFLQLTLGTRPRPAATARSRSSAWTGVTSASSWRPERRCSLNLRMSVYGTRPTAVWDRSTEASTNWCSSSKLAPPRIPIHSDWATPDVTAPMCGIIPASIRCGRVELRSWRCIQPSSRSGWSPTPLWIAHVVTKWCSTRSLDRAAR
jgi:hypothetical protein